MLTNKPALAYFLRTAEVFIWTAMPSVAAAEPKVAAVGPSVVSTSAERPKRLLFITTVDCQECDLELNRLRKPGGDFNRMQAQGWKIGEGPENHLQLVDREQVPELIDKLKPSHFPVIAYIDHGEIVRSFRTGCTTPLDAWTFGWLAKGIDERPKVAVPQAARVETTGHYPLRGNHWSIDGDWNPTQTVLLAHLQGPVHGQQVLKYGKIDAWSYEELRSLHDNLHEIEMGGVSAGSSRSSRSSDTMSATRKSLGRAF